MFDLKKSLRSKVLKIDAMGIFWGSVASLFRSFIFKKIVSLSVNYCLHNRLPNLLKLGFAECFA